MDFIHSQNVITEFELFVHRWYLLENVAVVFVKTYMTVVIVTARMSAVMS